MNMDLTQTKLIGLTLELEIKAKEYKDLCAQLDQLKEEGISPNDPKLLILKSKFESNQQSIADINRQLRELNNNKE